MDAPIDPGQSAPPPVAPPVETPAPSAFSWDGIITKEADGSEKMADWSTWRDKLPAPVQKFVGDNIAAARAKTEGMVKLPGADAPPEEWTPILKALGHPDTPEGYEIAKPEALPEGVEWNDEFAAGFAKFAHEAGLPKGQAQRLIAWHTEQMGAQAKAMAEAGQKFVEAERVELTKAFGPRLPEAAGAAQKFAADNGLPASMFDPAAGDFIGVPALKAIDAALSQVAKLTKEGSFKAPHGNSPIQGGKAYAEAVVARKHPDSEAYYKGDRDVVRRVGEALRAA